MQHSDPDVLALVALGERPAGRRRRAPPASATSAARTSSSSARSSPPSGSTSAGPAVAPPDRVWQGIAAATGVRAAPRPDEVQAAAAAPPSAPRAGAAPAGRRVAGCRRARRPATPPAGPRRPDADRGRGRRPRRRCGRAASWVRACSTQPPPPPRRPGNQQIVSEVDLKNLQPDVTRRDRFGRGRAHGVGQQARRRRVEAEADAGPLLRGLADRQRRSRDGVARHPRRVDRSSSPSPTAWTSRQYPIVDISVQQPGTPSTPATACCAV